MTAADQDLALRLFGFDRVERALAGGGLRAALAEALEGEDADRTPTLPPPAWTAGPSRRTMPAGEDGAPTDGSARAPRGTRPSP